MPRQTRAEIEQSLLKGNRVPWVDGGKQELLELNTPVRRRLFEFLLRSKVRVVKGLSDAFVIDLAEAFDSDLDPATATITFGSQSKTAGPWRLTRIETEGFGGVNVWGGPRFIYELDGQSLLIDGPNGSGKSSLVAALTWALTGQRPRDASRGTEEPGQSQVFDSKGAKVGDWPPLACYPDKASLLAINPFVQVKLTLKNPAGDEAAVERTLRDGQISHNVDPRLELPPVLIETGLMMPIRLAHIRFGAGEQHLTDAVQMLTGLDEIALLGEFVGELCHKARDYLGYSKAQRRDELMHQFTVALTSAKTALASIGQKLPEFIPSDTRDKTGSMAELGKKFTDQAAESVSVISADLAPNLDLTLAAVQQQVASAIDAARSEMDQGLAGLPSWSTNSTIATALTPEASATLAAAVAAAKIRLQEALELNKKADEDSRFQLKAIAAAWHQQHSSGAVDDCPLCAQSLKNNPLAAEIEHFRSVGDAAQRTYRDNMNAIQRDLEAAIPSLLRRFRSDVIGISPKLNIEAALRARFVDAPRYATYLTGLGGLVSVALSNTPVEELPNVAPIAAEGFPQGTTETLEAISIADRFLTISEWTTKNQGLWQQWWEDLTGQTLSPVPQDRFAGKLTQLDDAMRASTPYRDAAKGLREAWKHGLVIDKIDIEQKRRQDIADELEPLKALRKFAEAETKNAIEGLSSRMATLLDGIHIVEKLKFHSTHMDKKTGVTIRGGFDPDIRIDASLVANTSWLRALLWSFVFAVRQEAVEQLGEDRLPLLVLDDPQSTFDLTHRHRWAQYIAALQKVPNSVQIILATYDEPFLAQLETDKVEGIRAYLAAADTDTGCLSLVEGDSLKRSWADAMSKKTPEAAQAFISKTRIHLETMLKIMLRGEGETRTLVIGNLREKIKELHLRGVTPWNRAVFKDLANLLEKQPSEIQHLESSHHSTGLTLGMAEATDVEKYWRKDIEPQLKKAFRAIREYRLLHGESRAMHADPSVVEMPPGHREVVRQIPLEIHGRAAALTNGRLADGNLTMTELVSHERERVVLGKHDAFRLVTPTLEPVARPGDVVLVAEHGKVVPGSLVVAICSDHLLARRYQVSLEHPDIAILTAQAVSPSAIAPPLIAHISTVKLQKIVGVLFDPAGFPVSAPPGHEVADCGGDAAVKKLVSGTLGLVKVSGGSAEPQALDGQYLLIGDAIAPDIACRTLDGRPIIATDSNGNQYFKRLRVVSSEGIVLESLHSGGDYPPVFLSAPGKAEPTIDRVWPVIGVLFERP